MPLLTDLSTEADWVEPDEVPRALVTYGIVSDTFGDFELEPHHHAKSQLLLVQRGALSCEVEGGLWIVPPQSAIWIPGGTVHAMKVTGALEGYAAFVAVDANEPPYPCCRVVAVTPLLRELLIRCAGLPLLYDEGGANVRLTAVLIDELAAASAEDLHLPMPVDPRLRRVIDLMIASPSDRGTLDVWAGRAGMSTRTMERAIRRETGMSFGRWRQQLALMLAVKWLAGGSSIQQVAADLGYESIPSFVTMFRKALGAPPGRYMVERHASGR
ncbi:AraC family transcriptional regulator [Methylobacterium sp. R2-1]|uniref:AraC family transcriptional regulator n=1 Tax=Methylobacterium sp. R2-1 TaxID=2587064 RepID=UPI00160A935E|nr:helix-turn-helix transcriptional regulator [Methylobacterium sp. R2-1]MBB2964771.1 AraC-like DNA-binding protein/mannose-6-phosphate isomerase-like protein (cupin superfamily) [Methylobacterium sp. R2-1]